jgi:hypothetical protein
MNNTILQIIKIDSSYVDEIKSSFNDLPETDHADGSYRLRKYARVSVNVQGSTVEIEDLGSQTFVQSSKYNKHQGGMSRNFDSISQDVLKSACMRTMGKSFREACHLEDFFTMDIHQMRVRCTGGATQLSPEGWHQDGYDCVAIIGIARKNIIGGEVLLSTSKTDPPFLQAVMDSGTMVIVDDSHLWHNGRSIQPIKDSDPAYMDILVFTAKK